MCLIIQKIYSCGHPTTIPSWCSNRKVAADGMMYCSYERVETIRYRVPCGACQRKSVEQMNELEEVLENIEL